MVIYDAQFALLKLFSALRPGWTHSGQSELHIFLGRQLSLSAFVHYSTRRLEGSRVAWRQNGSEGSGDQEAQS